MRGDPNFINVRECILVHVIRDFPDHATFREELVQKWPVRTSLEFSSL